MPSLVRDIGVRMQSIETACAIEQEGIDYALPGKIADFRAAVEAWHGEWHLCEKVMWLWLPMICLL